MRRVPRDQYRAQALMGKLSLVDLAGSERAAETNNIGQKLRDGANINRCDSGAQPPNVDRWGLGFRVWGSGVGG